MPIRPFLRVAGRFDEAIAEIKTAIDRLIPTSFFNQRIYANGLYFARRYDEAVAQYKRMIEVNEENPALTIGSLEHWKRREMNLKRMSGFSNL